MLSEQLSSKKTLPQVEESLMTKLLFRVLRMTEDENEPILKQLTEVS